MQRAEIEASVAAVSLPAVLTVSSEGSKRAKLRAVLVEAVTTDGKVVHLLLASPAEAIQLFPGQQAAFVVEEAVQCHGRTLLCASVKQHAFCNLRGGASLPAALMTVEEFEGNNNTGWVKCLQSCMRISLVQSVSVCLFVVFVSRVCCMERHVGLLLGRGEAGVDGSSRHLHGDSGIRATLGRCAVGGRFVPLQAAVVSFRTRTMSAHTT